MRLRGGFILLLGSVLLAGPAFGGGRLQGLKTSVDAQGTTILLQLENPVEFTPSQIGPKLYLMDLAGVESAEPTDVQPVQSPLVSSYRVFSYRGADDRPHTGIELALKTGAEIRTRAVPEGLEIRVQSLTPLPPAAVSTPKPVASQPVVAESKPVAAEVKPVAAQSRPVSPRRATLREVSVVRPDGASGLEVEIIADGEVSYKTLKLVKPDRLVVDLENTTNQIRQRTLDVNTPPLQAVRISQFRSDPPVARIVLDLNAQVPYQIRNESNGLVVALTSAGADSGQPVLKSPAVAAASPAENPSEPQAAPAEPVLLASNNPSSVVTPVSMPAGRPAAPAVAEPVAEREPAPPAVVEPVAVREAFPAPAPSMALSPAATGSQSAPAAAELAGQPQAEMPTSFAEASRTEPVLLAMQAPAAGSSQAQQQSFTGEPISLNLKDVDLKDFFRLMHEVSGLNVVLDPNVSGVVTIVLDEVPWDQAMDVVMKNNGLEARTTGNVVRIARVSTLEAEAKAQLAKVQAEQQREELATPTQTVTRTLSYATANDLVPPLKRFLSARGDIVPDPRTNTLIITDVPLSIGKIDTLIANLDKKTPQVEIEARIVAATRSFARDIGVQLAVSGASGNVVLGGAGIVGESPISRGTVPPLFIGTPPEQGQGGTTFANVAQPLSVNFGAVGPTSGLSLVLTGGTRFALDSIITAAESKGLGKLLSRPKIITQNNVEGNVEQGVRIPIQTTINNTISTQYINVTLRLTVTPQITAEGTIFLKTDIENTTINPGIPRILGQPALNTQSANTQVLVSDGGTVFFGGIIQTENNLNENEVPLLGSLPLVGRLFKRRATSTTTQELLFFITPKITQS